MSLNRHEQMLFDYWQRHPDELHFWQDKVRRLAAGREPDPAMVLTLNAELRRYCEERSRVTGLFREMEMTESQGLRRLSLLNLAEQVLRLWLPPRPTKKKPPAGRD